MKMKLYEVEETGSHEGDTNFYIHPHGSKRGDGYFGYPCSDTDGCTSQAYGMKMFEFADYEIVKAARLEDLSEEAQEKFTDEEMAFVTGFALEEVRLAVLQTLKRATNNAGKLTKREFKCSKEDIVVLEDILHNHIIGAIEQGSFFSTGEQE